MAAVFLGVVLSSTKTYIWNIEDLDDPINTNVHVSTETSSDHNLYITGSYVSTIPSINQFFKKHELQ